MSRLYHVYILASRSRNLYVGITGDLHSRMIQHRQELLPGFTARYRVFRLVHLEHFTDVIEAIAREKEIKAWRREKKIWLIERHNPTWQDLAGQLPCAHQNQKQIPHTARGRLDRVRDDNLGAKSVR